MYTCVDQQLISCFTDLKYHLIRFCFARKLINDNKQLSAWRCFTMCDILDRLINCCIISVIIVTRIHLLIKGDVRSYSKSMSYISGYAIIEKSYSNFYQRNRKCIPFRSTWVHFPISGVRVTRSLVFCVMIYWSLFLLLSFFLLSIVLSVLLRFTDSDYPFGIFWPLCWLFFFDIRILIPPLGSSNSSYPISCSCFVKDLLSNDRWPYPVLAILFRPFGFLVPKDFFLHYLAFTYFWLWACLLKFVLETSREHRIWYLLHCYINIF